MMRWPVQQKAVRKIIGSDAVSGFRFKTSASSQPLMPPIMMSSSSRSYLGADDYIAKPYSIKIVMARIEAVLRRTRGAAAAPKVTESPVVCDRQSLTCLVDGSPVKLARKEFEILALMLDNPSRVFSREELLEKIWPDKVVVVDRAVDVHITRLRGKIAPYGKHIVTRSGYGYGWED